MTELPSTELAITSSMVLAWVATGLLVFVSAGVIYLSVVDWRDRRRRRADEAAAPPPRKRSGKSSGSSSRPPTAFGRRP